MLGTLLAGVDRNHQRLFQFLGVPLPPPGRGAEHGGYFDRGILAGGLLKVIRYTAESNT